MPRIRATTRPHRYGGILSDRAPQGAGTVRHRATPRLPARPCRLSHYQRRWRLDFTLRSHEVTKWRIGGRFCVTIQADNSLRPTRNPCRQSRGQLAESLLHERRRSFAPAPGVTTKLVLAIGRARCMGNTHSVLSRTGERARRSRWRSKAAASVARCATQQRPTRRGTSAIANLLCVVT
jgi:hypothetical protein